MLKIALIPARGGSRRIPRKNIRSFHGKPIIAYSIETAIAATDSSGHKLFDGVHVWSDDEEIMEVAKRYGALALGRRPPELARDEVGTQEVAQAYLEWLRENLELSYVTHLCVIYPTAPLMSKEDLRRGFETLIERKTWYAFSIGTNPLHDAGQFYWGIASAFWQKVPLFDSHSAMVPVDPSRVCDINTEEDWQRAERMFLALP